jgi:hypothetical protein
MWIPTQTRPGNLSGLATNQDLAAMSVFGKHGIGGSHYVISFA